MENGQIAQVFAEMADALAIQGQDKDAHRIRAYRLAAESVAALGRPLREIQQAGELQSIPGIGKVLEAKIDELMRTGRLEAHEKLLAQVPAGVLDMLRIPGIGPRRAALFWKELGITSIEALEAAARAGRLSELPGIGAASEERVIEGIEILRDQSS